MGIRHPDCRYIHDKHDQAFPDPVGRRIAVVRSLEWRQAHFLFWLHPGRVVHIDDHFSGDAAHRPRPLHNPSIDYQLPFGIQDSVLKGWSSFPSDTSALAFSIVAGIFMASTRLGLAALAWAVMVVSFPRAYAGLHYPSDLLGGALIGFLCTICAVPVVQCLAVSKPVAAIPVKWHPLLWVLAFFYLFQMGTMFNDIRAYGSYVKTVFGF